MDLLMQFEIQITLFFQHLGNWPAIPFSTITFLGNEEFYLLVMPALYWCIDATLGFRLGAMLVLTNSLNGYLKVLFHSPRPYWVDTEVKAFTSETSFGLPSGHAQNAASLMGILAVSLKKKWVTIVCAVLIFLIGLSRIYLGVHFTRDVISGWIIGLLLIFIYLLLEKPISNWIAPKPLSYKICVSFLVSLAIIAIGFLVNLPLAHWKIPSEWVTQAVAASGIAPDPLNQDGNFTIAGVWFGFAAGYAWWLQRKGQIIISGSAGQRIGRYLLGLAGVILLYAGLKVIFPASPDWAEFAFRYIRYALIGLWVSALAPLLFEKLRLDS